MNSEEHVSTYCPLQKRVVTNFTKESYGRGREVKFQKYSEWNHKNYPNFFDRWWFDMKTLENYASGMAPHKFSFVLDSLHSLAYLWACEDGILCRRPESQIASFCFKTCNIIGIM